MRFFNLFPSYRKGLKIVDQVKECCENIIKAIELAKEQYQESVRDKEFMEEMFHAAGGFIWGKDREHRYTFANQLYCQKFLMPHAEKAHHFSHRCTEETKGLTDDDLLLLFEKSTGKRHTFRNFKRSSDEFTRRTSQKCHFIEMGFIGDQPMAIHWIKTPIYTESGEYDGTVALGADLSFMYEYLMERVDAWTARGEARKLEEGIYLMKAKQQDCHVMRDTLLEDRVESSEQKG